MILLKEFIELNVNTNMIIKNVKLAELNIKIASAFLNENFRENLIIKYKCLCCDKNYEKKFHENLKKGFFNI